MAVAEQEPPLRHRVPRGDSIRKERTLPAAEALFSRRDESLDLPSVEASRPSPEDRVELDTKEGMANGDRCTLGHHALVERPGQRVVSVALIDDGSEETAVYDERVRKRIADAAGSCTHGPLPTSLVGLPACSIQSRKGLWSNRTLRLGARNTPARGPQHFHRVRRLPGRIGPNLPLHGSSS